jgi:hypothetical protein
VTDAAAAAAAADDDDDDDDGDSCREDYKDFLAKNNGWEEMSVLS